MLDDLELIEIKQKENTWSLKEMATGYAFKVILYTYWFIARWLLSFFNSNSDHLSLIYSYILILHTPVNGILYECLCVFSNGFVSSFGLLYVLNHLSNNLIPKLVTKPFKQIEGHLFVLESLYESRKAYFI
jgi:hypothetical protein